MGYAVSTPINTYELADQDSVADLGTITLADTGNDQFTVAGSHNNTIAADVILVNGSTGNDGTYKITAINEGGGNTIISVDPSFFAVADATADGNIYVLKAHTVTHNLNSENLVVQFEDDRTGAKWPGGYVPLSANQIVCWLVVHRYEREASYTALGQSASDTFNILVKRLD